jgi:hypothetical protein
MKILARIDARILLHQSWLIDDTVSILSSLPWHHVLGTRASRVSWMLIHSINHMLPEKLLNFGMQT